MSRSVLISFIFVLLLSLGCSGPVRYYDPEADGVQQVQSALLEAKASGRYVLVQVGGDWCQWCLRLNETLSGTDELSELLSREYVWVHLYYGSENKNDSALSLVGKPLGLGFPVFVVLNGDGSVLRIQETGGFESGEGYSISRLKGFLETDWSAVPPIASSSVGGEGLSTALDTVTRSSGAAAADGEGME